jgi:septal ring factor EnvC (AmiA/AmiB activator)
MRVLRVLFFCAIGLPAVATFVDAASPTGDQLHAVRMRIDRLQERLTNLDREAATVEREHQQLDAQLQLADARMLEVELLLAKSAEEASQLRGEAARLSEELANRRELLERHLELMALLGKPGPMQLFFDAYKGGELEQAVGTVSVLTAGQSRLMDEYWEVQKMHGVRLAELSQTLELAQVEARQLESRRSQLEEVRQAVATRLEKLQRSRLNAGASLEDLRARESALERLVGVLASKNRLTGDEDIRRYRGALPWPVDGRVVQRFGRQRLAKYNTYTVCNGLRFDVRVSRPVTAVFPGIVAFARHFKGYGNMVVLDHGNDVYSLVSGLATIHVAVDQRVSMGTRLGLASASSEDGNIYLEIRVNERPEDPKRWLQLERGAS